MDNKYKIRLAARCEAAGRPENEDNFQVAADLSVGNKGFKTDQIIEIGEKGTLLLVCDGMGGMNAGEVASAVGVKTIEEMFSPDRLTTDVLESDETICAYIRHSIVCADREIKEEAAKDESKKGMGSTCVMAWLIGTKVYVGWCGDSRAYRYNPITGLEQLSHDHSYVQSLVDTGQLSAELAFDHPNKNIITRSLGDPRGNAKPETKVYNLERGDVILLCSDGLSDSLRDSQIELSIKNNISSMTSCRDALWNDSYVAGWHDNVTVVLAQVMDEKQITPSVQATQESTTSDIHESHPINKNTEQHGHLQLNWKTIGILGGCILVLSVVVLVLAHAKFNANEGKIEQLSSKIQKADFCKVNYKDLTDTIKAYKGYYEELVKLTPSDSIVNNCMIHFNDEIDERVNQMEKEHEETNFIDEIKKLKIEK